ADKRQVARDSRRAPDLDGAVHHPRECGRYENLDRRDVRARVAAAIHTLGAVNGHQARSLNVDVRLGDEALDELLGLELAAVHLTHRGPLDHQVERAPHLPDRVHAMIDAPGTEAILRGLMA